MVAGIECHLWEEPLGQVAAVIRQRPALEVDHFFTAIVQLNPVAIHSIVALDRGGAEFTDHHVAGDMVRVDLHRPRLAGEPVWGAVKIGDVGVICPRQFRLAKQDRFKIKQVRPRAKAGDRGGRDAVGHQVACVHALHRFIEPDLRLTELPDCTFRGQVAGQARGYGVEQFVRPECIFRRKRVRWGGLVSDTVGRRPPDIDFSRRQFVQLECKGVALGLDGQGGVVVDHQVAGLDAGHWFAERDGD